MVEMTETAMILHNATPRSLVLLDEIGRGTSTFDGLAIAWSVAEYLHNSPEHSAKTLSATHYHELEELHFEGLALTDDLEMGAIIKNYGIGEASKMAVHAGSDFLLICNDPISIYEGYNAVLEAVKSGEITETRIEESINRIETSRKKLTQPLEFSLKRIAELSREMVD